MDEVVRQPASEMAFLAGGGEMGALVRAHDWAATPLGPVEGWPECLRVTVSTILAVPQAMWIGWGPEFVQIYNDGYRALLDAERHSTALGRPAAETWADNWSVAGSMLQSVFAGGPAVFQADRREAYRHEGEHRERFFSFSFSPIPLLAAPAGVGGVLCVAVETTPSILLQASETRQAFLLKLSDALRAEQGVEAIANRGLRMLLEQMRLDRCYIGVYRLAEDIGDFPHQVHDERLPPLPAQVRLSDFPEALQVAFDRTLVINDVVEMEGLSSSDRASFSGLGLRALIAATLHKGENNPLWAVVAVSTASRVWTEGEVSLVEEVAERIWAALERARADARLRESEARFRLMADAVPQIIWITDRHGRMEFFNRKFTDYTGEPGREATPAEIAAEFMHPEEGATVVAAFEAALTRGEAFEIEHRICSVAGEYRWFLARAEPFRDAETREIARWFGASVDIHDRRQAEEALRESEARLRELNADLERRVTERSLARGRTWQLSPEIMGVLNADGYFEQSNPAWQTVLGWSEAEVAGTVFFDLIHPDDLPKTQAAWTAAIERGEPALGFENRYRTKDGGWRWLSWVAVPDGGKVYCSARDVTVQKEQEAELAERTAERDRTWANSRDLLLVVGADGVFREVNPAWTRLLGWSQDELIDRSYVEFIHPDDHSSSQGALTTASQGELPVFENRYRHKDGSYRCISWLAAPEGNLIYAYGRDITAEKGRETELEQAQDALRQSQKLDAMGQLTGGVAHDFNNLLTPIIASLDMLMRRGLGSERERRLMDGALQSAERAKVLVQRLLAFARKQPLQPGPVDVQRLVGEMAELIASTSGPRIDVRVNLPDDLPPALADANQLEMAVLNLAVNARDAMPDAGVLTISAARESVRGRHPAKLRPGHYVRLSVADTGEGMDEATLARAVEPFFSTKGIGKGTGLGLSMVHGLAEQLGGGLTIASRPRQGTTVSLWLPLSAVAAEEDGQAIGLARDPQAQGTALLVDDEDLVRMSTADMLMDLGYEVVEASSAEEALRLVEEGLAPDLVVTDHLMPGLSGLDLARELRSCRPDLPVLIISGYAQTDGIAPSFPRLTKPFRSAELAASLAGLRLDGTR